MTFFKWCAAAVVALGLNVGAGAAQQLQRTQGDALAVDLVRQAQTLSMRNVYARSLYLHIRTNPQVMESPHFYVSYLVYLMSNAPEFDCSRAFSSEFERRDFFTQAFNLRPALMEAINSVTITQRFDVPFQVGTGNYDFNTGTLPLQNARPESIEGQLTRRASAGGTRGNPRGCAQQMLQGTTVEIDQFPWSFELINQAVPGLDPVFPFGSSLQLVPNDARVLFERFGRQLYAIVSYQVQAANDGSAKIQITTTDASLFGLSSDAIVQVDSFAHPTLSAPQYLDLSNPLTLDLPELRTAITLEFQQKGFRAVGTGTRSGEATDFSAARDFPVSGSAGVGNSAFILRVFTPQLTGEVRGLRNVSGADRYLTLFGSVDFTAITQTEAPVTGLYIVQQVNPDTGTLDASRATRFAGAFLARQTSAAPEVEAAPASQLDEMAGDGVEEGAEQPANAPTE